jgi:hypothetical protein
MLNRKNLWLTFWPLWIIANALGWLAISAIYILPFWGIWATVGVSLFLSLIQWLVLRHFMGVDSMWVWLSTATYGIFLFIVIYTVSDTPFSSNLTLLVVAFLCLGLLGFLQRIALAYHLDRATIWVVASSLAGVIGLMVAFGLSTLLQNSSPAFVWGITGILYGMITGIALIYLREYTLKNADRPKYVPPPMAR